MHVQGLRGEIYFFAICCDKIISPLPTPNIPMRAARLAAVMALATAPLVSHAEIVSYAFTAHVEYIAEITNQWNYTIVGASGLAGALISMGDGMSGQITYDTSVNSEYISSDYTVYNGVIKSLSIKFNPTGLQFQSVAGFDTTYIAHHPSGDDFDYIDFFAADGNSPGHAEGTLDLTDFSGTALNSTAIPLSLSM
jgi:hypothetical protein